ncbi:MAG: hypothetical protein HOV87_23960 [Catenulispora sp.]|nr:hypothetical protein [Catenulispora sp.]
MNTPNKRHRARIHRNARTRTFAATACVTLAATTASVGIATPAHATFQGDNGTIAFTTVVNGVERITVAKPDGSGQHLLDPIGPGMSVPPSLHQAVYSPDGSRIAFVENNSPFGLWTGNADGTHLVRLTTPASLTADGDPAWSPDGTKVFFTRFGRNPATAQIFSTFADGSGGTSPLAPTPTGFIDSAPDVAPNGDVAFMRTDGPAPGVYVRRANGAVALFAANGRNPSYNPLGTLLAYGCQVIIAGKGICDKPTAGGPETFIPGTGFGEDPVWSPNGFKLLYQVSPPNVATHLQTVDVNSGTITDLPGAAGDEPSWQPLRRITIDRVGGDDRIDTAVATSQLGYDNVGAGARQAGGAVLTRADSFADALAGSALAAHTNAPLLLTATGGLDPRVEAELKRVLKPGSQVTLLGGPDVMSPAVEARVAALGFTTRRLAGPDRYATAVAIAAAITPSPDRILVATGNNFPDALAAGAAAGTGKNSVVLLSDDRTLPSSTAAYLASRTAATTGLFGVGDQGVAALRTAFPADRVTTVAGPDRFATAAAVAGTFFTGPTAPHTVGLAIGTNWPDALAGGAVLGAHGAPLLLADGSHLPAVEGDYAAAHAGSLDEVLAFGGTDVVPDGAAFAIGDAAGVPGLRSSFVNRKAPFLP